jgi:drug efflux transport system permease protein
MNKTLLSIIRKEFRHIIRDKQTLIILFIMPVLMLFLYGYAITLEMKNIKTVIVDLSKTPQSRAFVDNMQANDFFKVVDMNISYDQYESVFQTRKAQCIVVIPQDFSRSLAQRPQTKIQLLIDASDPNAANFINNYLNIISASYNLEQNRNLVQSISLEPRLLYNPDMKSAYFFVPGLIAVIALLICALLTSIAIVREKENGTMEQILVSPVKSMHIIIGKVIPYMVIGYLMALMILVIGHFWFQVPIYGSFLLLNVILLLYVLTGLSFGLLISTQTNSQQIALMITLVSTILPSFMLSGFIFPIASMPQILQYISNLIPATHFLIIIRSIMLKGVGIAELTTQIAALSVVAFVLLMISMRKFQTHLE